MCGIAGIVDLRGPRPGTGALVASMTDALAHRGPDDDGLHEDGECVLGHRRLSILDLSSAGRQPMCTPDGRYWVTYNGEIYNYIEVASDLRARGHAFATHCDTEVLLHAFAEWGPACLDRLNGMFAFALWDSRTRRLFCARDRLGVKPFYYAVADGRFRFASEIKALLADDSLPRRPNDARVRDFLAWGLADHTEETLFEGILQLPAGSQLTVADGRVGPPSAWWRPHPADAADALAPLLESAVRIRLRSDVPVGTCLSGGLDSSSVVALAAKVRHELSVEPPASFSARCDDPRLDEGRYIDAVVAHTRGVGHSVVPGGDDALRWLDWVVWHQDEPFHGASVLGQSKVMELARAAGVTVLLDGQGGDEVFAGYHFLYPSFFWTLALGGRARTIARELSARAALHGVGIRTSVVDVAKLLAPARLRNRATPAWLRPERRPAPRSLPGRRLHDQQAFGLAVSPLPAYLHHEDRNSMAFSLEARLPLLDYRVVEQGLRLPPERLISRGYGKWALREAMRPDLPPSIVDRAGKQGFTVEEARWLRDGLRPALLELAAPSALSHEYVDGRAVVAGDAEGVWRALTFERWLRLYIAPTRLEAPTPPSPLLVASSG